MFETPNRTALVLDGRSPADSASARLFEVLLEVLQRRFQEVRVLSLADMKLAHCIGCFACWDETPGICRYHERDATLAVQAVAESDLVVLVTPVTFGGYSARLKQIVDRLVVLVLPYFGVSQGEVHHLPRYSHYPRWLAVGVQAEPNAAEAGLFKLLAGRNAINLQARSYAADVVQVSDDRDTLATRFRSMLVRDDPLPWKDTVKSLLPRPDSLSEWDGGRRATLVVGSPKTLSPSTSGVLGEYLLARLRERGWDTQSLTLTPAILKPQGQGELLAAVDRADLLVLAFPLYVDALPFLATRALELIAEHKHGTNDQHRQRLVAIANNGFPEAYQSHLALAMCRQFAAQTGRTWVGGLALGAGEGLIGGRPLQPRMASGQSARHVIKGLNATAAALAEGKAVPPEAVRDLASNPIPGVPAFVWRHLFVRIARAWWNQRAARHGVAIQALYDQPYATATRR
jgi:NAD(P)H-dependent FMN reductase